MGKLSSKAVFFAFACLLAVFAFSARRSQPVRSVPKQPVSLAGLELPALAGGAWSMERERGKVVLLNFWATWCPPCRQETPELVKLHEKYKDRGFTVVGVSLDDDPQDAVPAFVERYRIPYPIALPGDSPLARGIEGLPTTLLIGPDGMVAETYVGAVTEDNLRAGIERLLAAAAEKGGV